MSVRDDETEGEAVEAFSLEEMEGINRMRVSFHILSLKLALTLISNNYSKTQTCTKI